MIPGQWDDASYGYGLWTYGFGQCMIDYVVTGFRWMCLLSYGFKCWKLGHSLPSSTPTRQERTCYLRRLLSLSAVPMPMARGALALCAPGFWILGQPVWRLLLCTPVPTSSSYEWATVHSTLMVPRLFGLQWSDTLRSAVKDWDCLNGVTLYEVRRRLVFPWSVTLYEVHDLFLTDE